MALRTGCRQPRIPTPGALTPNPPENPPPMTDSTSAIPFETFARFERLTPDKPPLYCEPPAWAAAAHAIVVDDTVHYLWAKKQGADNSWVHMHSQAPAADPTAVEHDPRNPVLEPSAAGFDDLAVEYPFPFYNPADQRYYAYYLGNSREKPRRKQTGLLLCDGDLGAWRRAGPGPVVGAGGFHEESGSSHPSVAVDGDTIHMVYTGERPAPPERREILYNVPTICHATAPTRDPSQVTKDLANPVFTGSGQAWDRWGVREAEILKGPVYFHIFYGGYDGKAWSVGHVRTRDFRTFEPNPHNPVLTPSKDPQAWDSNGLLTPQVFAIDGDYYMLYAGLKGSAWNDVSQVQSGLAIARPTSG